MAPDIPLIRTA
ncbi:hypothetical protein JCM11641_004126 [Rhodosporidiobolus odoratus]